MTMTKQEDNAARELGITVIDTNPEVAETATNGLLESRNMKIRLRQGVGSFVSKIWTDTSLNPFPPIKEKRLTKSNAYERKSWMRNLECPCGSGKKFKKCCWQERVKIIN